MAEQKKGPEGVRALTQEESDEFDAQRRLSMLLHLRIETFYLFAQRLLDHLVFAADVIFAPAPITIGRHRTLRTNLDKLAATGRVAQPPEGFWPLFEEITERIKDFRDDYVAHTHHARMMKSTLLRFEDEAPRIHLGVMFPKEGEVLDVTSEPLDVLLPLIDRWASLWLDYLEPVLLRPAT